MKKQFFLLVLAVIFFTHSVCSAGIPKEDFLINEIDFINNTYEDVLVKLGPPKRQTTDEKGEPPLNYLTYPGLRVWTFIDTNKIAFILVDNNQFQTKRGIRVGGTSYKVIKEYGDPERQTIKGHRYFIYKTDSSPEKRLIFDMSEGYVSRIIITSLPNMP